MKAAFIYHAFILIIIFYISLKVSEKDILQVYDLAHNKKDNKRDSSLRQLKRILYKKTGALLSPLESLYFILVVGSLAFIYTLIPLFDEAIYLTSAITVDLSLNGTMILLTIILLAFMKLLAPRRFIEMLGKEYFVSSALSQLLMSFMFAMMFYLYGSMKIQEMVVYQATESLLGLPNWGLILNPFLFLSAVAILALSEKSRGRTRQISWQRDSTIQWGTGKETLVDTINLLNNIMLTLMIVLLFMGGYHIPEIGILTNIEMPGFTTLLQSIVLLVKTYFLFSMIGLVKKITALRSDYRLNRLKIFILFPNMLIGLLVMPIFYFGRG